MSHILETNTRLSHRLDSLEQRTRHEVSGDQYHGHASLTTSCQGSDLRPDHDGDTGGGAERPPGQDGVAAGQGEDPGQGQGGRVGGGLQGGDVWSAGGDDH